MVEKKKAIDALIDLISAIMLVNYFLIDVYQLWEYKFLGYGISSIIMAGLTVGFLLLVFVQYKHSLGIFELLLGGIIIGLGIGAHSYGRHPWFLNFTVYQCFFALAVAVIINSRPMKSWIFLLPMFLALGYFVALFIQDHSIYISKAMPKINRNTFAITIITFGLLGSINLLIHKVWQPISFVLFSILMLLLSFLSFSRGAIVVAIGYFGFLFLLVLYKLYIDNKVTRSKKTLARLVIYLIVSVLLFGLALMYTLRYSRLATDGLYGTGRREIYLSFLESYTWKSVLVGVPSSALMGYYHYHNSFFQALGQSGLIGWMIISLYCYTLYLLIRYKRFDLIAIFGLISIYSLVEHYMFLAIGDLVLFPLMVFAYHSRKRPLKDLVFNPLQD